MGIGAIFSLIMGIFFIILGILIINSHRLHPEEELTLISILFPFILGIIGIMGAITSYIGLTGLLVFIIVMSFSIYFKRKYPEIMKNQKKFQEIYKKQPLYKFSRYILLGWGIFLGAFILILVLFNVTF